MNDTQVWAQNNTCTKAHAFLGSRGAKEGNLRATCSTRTQRSVDATYIDQDRARKLYTLCDRCVKLYAEAEARAEASMGPATESDDLGYVAPVDERIEAPQPAKAPQAPARTMSEYLAERRQDAATEAAEQLVDETVAPGALAGCGASIRVGRDTLMRTNEHWGLVTLHSRRTYIVSMKVSRKADHGTWRVLFDNATYWAERDGSRFGSTRAAGENDEPGTVGGRIWALLLAAGIA